MNFKSNIVFYALIIIILYYFIFVCINKEGFSNLNHAPEKVFVFWTGNNKMSINRRRCYNSIKKNIGVPVVLVTPKNLNKFIHKDYPIHPAFKYLSLVHKSDYLRTYFMHLYGGGYTDIKQTDVNWKPFFKNLNSQSNKWCNGYTEIAGGTASNDSEIHKKYYNYIGNGAYIFKPRTQITKKWFDTLNIKLDENYEKLKENPGQLCDSKNDCKETKYPIYWSYLLGSHFHDILKPYQDKILHDLPLINTNNYR